MSNMSLDHEVGPQTIALVSIWRDKDDIKRRDLKGIDPSSAIWTQARSQKPVVDAA